MVVWLEISTAAPIALRLEFGNARVMPWTWQSFTANAVCGPSEGCLIIFGGIVLMPRVISSTVALAMFLQHEHHLREAADYIPIDQLGTTDDCGFVPFADDTSSRRNMTFEKIRVRIVGTRLASEALGREDWTRALHAGVLVHVSNPSSLRSSWPPWRAWSGERVGTSPSRCLGNTYAIDRPIRQPRRVLPPTTR